ASETVSADQARTWLMREARAMAQISHPNVLAVHDIGTLGDQMFIAMEYVDGMSISHWLTVQDRPWRDVLGVFIQAGHGLAAAHSRGILHCDFKPENVLVDKDGRVRLVDFGLARFEDSHTTATQGKFIGTPSYMAPEQLIGEPVDEKTDQYSF